MKSRTYSISQKLRETMIFSHTHISSEPPVYIRLLYKLINVINRPGRIAWESVFCTETVSILNEKEGGREEERERHTEREREISTFFFSFCIVLFLILICPLCPLFCRVCWKGFGALQSARIRQNSRGTDFSSLYPNLQDLTGIEPRSSYKPSSKTLIKGVKTSAENLTGAVWPHPLLNMGMWTWMMHLCWGMLHCSRNAMTLLVHIKCLSAISTLTLKQSIKI